MRIKTSKDKRNKSSPYVVRWSYGPDLETGKAKWKCRSFKYKMQAEQFIAELRAKVIEPEQSHNKKEEITLGEFLTDWLKIKKPDSRPETLKLYKNTEERFLTYFGSHKLLSEITPRSAAKFISELKRIDGRPGELSGWSRDRTLRNSKTIFSTAVDWGEITENPFSLVKHPKLIKQRWHYLTADEFSRLLNARKEKRDIRLRYKIIYSLAYCCGLRLGEIVNLMWNDIDFDKAEIRIESRPANTERPPFMVKDKEARRVTMPEYLLNLLADLKTYNDVIDQTPYVAINEQQYKTVVNKWKKYQQQGRPWANRDMQNNTLTTFKRHVRWAGIEPDGSLSIHTLRKTCITNWANNISNPEVVRRLAGHSDIKTTMEYYSKVTEEQRRKAAQAIDKVIAKTGIGS